MNDVIKILKGCRFEMIQIDKDEISKDTIGSEQAMYYLPKVQERLVCNVANNVANYIGTGNVEMEFLTIKKYLELKGLKWSKELDAKLGDIIVVLKGTTQVLACIDLKVANDGQNKVYYPQNRLFVGCITNNSYEWFAKNATRKYPHYYLCTSYDGSQFVIIDAFKLVDYVKAKNIKIDTVYKSDEFGSKYIPSCWVFKNEKYFCI